MNGQADQHPPEPKGKPKARGREEGGEVWRQDDHDASSLAKRQRQLEARDERLMLRDKLKIRKQSTRAKIIIGGAVLAEARASGDFAAVLLAILKRRVTDERDRSSLRFIHTGPDGQSGPGVAVQGDQAAFTDDADLLPGDGRGSPPDDLNTGSGFGVDAVSASDDRLDELERIMHEAMQAIAAFDHKAISNRLADETASLIRTARSYGSGSVPRDGDE